MLAALSTGHMIGMLVAAGLFIAYALLSSFVFPRYWPQFPGPRGLTAHIVVSSALFVTMLLAVELFAIEEEEAEAGTEPAAVSEEAPPETGGASASQTVPVSGTEFKFTLPSTELDAGPHVFQLANDGTIGHDLAIDGPGVEEEKTPVIDPGQTAELEVELEPGTYELYCTVPGHRDAGMETSVTVS